jgi:O-methyltransferase involved in polyketide biosynthesis
VGEKLVAAGFQQNSPAFFTWLGVVPYLTQDAIGRTLDYMSSIQSSEVLGFLAEASLMLWLIMKGVNVQRWKEQASAA